MSKYKQIKINLSPEDHARFSDAAAAENISMAELIRQKIGAKIEDAPAPKITRPVKKADPKLMYEMNRIGNNLNQIARHLNSGGKLDKTVLQILVNIEDEMRQL